MKTAFLISIGIFLCVATGSTTTGQVVWDNLHGPAGSLRPATVFRFNDTVFVGALSAGMYRSTNGGSLWTQVESDTAKTTLCFGRSQRGDIIALQNRKIKRSTDGGMTWRVTKMDVNTSITPNRNGIITRADGEMLLFGDATVYASSDNGVSWNFRANHRSRSVVLLAGGAIVSVYDSIYLSTDAGRTWSGRSKPEGGSVVQLRGMDASVLLLATVAGLQRSTDTGRTWSPYGSQIGVLDFACLDSGKIVVSSSSGLFRSVDSARTWNAIPFYFRFDLSDFLEPFADSIIYAGTSRGLLCINTSGPEWNFDLQNIGIVGSTHVYLDDAGTIFSGTEAHGIQYTTDGGATWLKSVLPKDTSLLALRSMLQLSSGVFLAGTRSFGLLASGDHGVHWSQGGGGTLPTDITALAQLPSGVVLAGSSAGVHVSTDDGFTWRVPTQPVHSGVSCFGRDDIRGRVYCGTNAGAFVSTDNGETWQTLGPFPDPPSIAINSLVVAPSGSVLAMQRDLRRLYRTTDGQSWTYLPRGFAIPGAEVTLAIDSRGNLYQRTGDGLYVSWNEGASWQQAFSAQEPNRTLCLLIADSGRAYVGTTNGGVYVSREGLWTSFLAPPELISPPDASTGRLVSEPFLWKSVSFAERYRFQVSTDASFSDPLLLDITITDTTDQGMPKIEFQQYFWRVRAERSGSIGNWSPAWRFTTRRQTPQTPLLRFPPDNAGSLAAPILFDWGPATGAETYSFELAHDSLMQSRILAVDTITTTQFRYDPDPVEHTYYWRVRASNPDTASPWSPVWRFTSAPYSGIPTLVSPLPGMTVSAHGVFLRWTAPHTWRKTAEVYISKDSTFTVSVMKAYPSVADADSTVVGGLEMNVRYYWKVRCIWTSGTTSPFSDTWSFMAVPGVPMPPIQRLPPDGADSVFSSIRCSWVPVEGRDTYTCEISTDPLLRSNVIRLDSLINSYATLDTAPMSTTLYWRVRANNSSGSGAWSPIWSFITAPFSGRPILTDPPNGATTGAYALWFQWQTPLTWQPWSFLEIFTDSALTRRKTHRYTYKYGSVAEKIIELEKNTKYYWRVRFTWSYGAYSAYSDTWSFTTNDVVDVDQPKSTSRPTHPVIAGNSPQPFASYTDITFALPVQSTATLRIHDALGRLVATLVDGVREAGTHQARFDAQGLPAGVYTARLETPSGSAQRVMLLVR